LIANLVVIIGFNMTINFAIIAMNKTSFTTTTFASFTTIKRMGDKSRGIPNRWKG